jgi:hypothetical protein
VGYYMCLQVGIELFQLLRGIPEYFKVPQSTCEFVLLYILDFINNGMIDRINTKHTSSTQIL